ncbi:hypothetical protein [Streptomyces sp. NPDC048445]|uniref:hypothetical protein n=1 Tax=Streptomyces sp. NPDC048445 TaxID=3365553 RepID=UPI00372073EC
MICDRCDRPMTADESSAYDIPGATGPGVTITVHRELCTPPPRRRTCPHPLC